MDDSRQAAFRERLTRMDDERVLSALLQMVDAPDQYRAEAIAAAKSEVSRRGITAEQLREAEGRAHQDKLACCLSDAVELALDGFNRGGLEGDLVDSGLDPTEAAHIAERAADLARERRRPAGFRKVVNGAGLCLLGCLLTWATYGLSGSILRVAAQPLAWGAVVVGVALCIRGIRQLRS